jgi:hypothetical protein
VEAIRIVYTQNTFRFGTVTSVICFPACVARPFFHSIRNLTIHFDPKETHIRAGRKYPPDDENTWEETWGVVAGMSGLRSLHVTLVGYGLKHAALEERILGPVAALQMERGIDNLVVTLGWNVEMGTRGRDPLGLDMLLVTEDRAWPFEVKRG